MPNIIFGSRNTPRGTAPLSLTTADRLQHSVVMGKSGVGKSTLLRNMVIQEMRAGSGVCIVDPHGDLASELLHFVPKSRTSDVILIRPYEDKDYPVGLNPLETPSGQDKELLTSSVLSIFRHLWSDSWGPRVEYFTYHAVRALLDYHGATFFDLYRMFLA